MCKGQSGVHLQGRKKSHLNVAATIETAVIRRDRTDNVADQLKNRQSRENLADLVRKVVLSRAVVAGSKELSARNCGSSQSTFSVDRGVRHGLSSFSSLATMDVLVAVMAVTELASCKIGFS